MAVDLGHIGRVHVGLTATAAAVAWLTLWADAGSILLGGAVMGANFWLLRAIGRLVGRAAAEPGKRAWGALALAAMTLKFALFLGLLAALFWRLPIAAMSFALGVSLLLVACVLEALGSKSGSFATNEIEEEK